MRPSEKQKCFRVAHLKEGSATLTFASTHLREYAKATEVKWSVGGYALFREQNTKVWTRIPVQPAPPAKVIQPPGPRARVVLSPPPPPPPPVPKPSGHGPRPSCYGPLASFAMPRPSQAVDASPGMPSWADDSRAGVDKSVFEVPLHTRPKTCNSPSFVGLKTSSKSSSPTPPTNPYVACTPPRTIVAKEECDDDCDGDDDGDDSGTTEHEPVGTDELIGRWYGSVGSVEIDETGDVDSMSDYEAASDPYQIVE